MNTEEEVKKLQEISADEDDFDDKIAEMGLDE